MPEIKPDHINEMIEIEAHYQCPNCSEEVFGASDESYDDALADLIETLNLDGWKFGTVGDSLGVFCPQCVEYEMEEGQ